MVGFRGGGGNRRRTHTGLVGKDPACHAVADDRTDHAAGHGLSAKGIVHDDFQRRQQQIEMHGDHHQSADYIQHSHKRHHHRTDAGNALNAAQHHERGNQRQHHAGNPSIDAEATVHRLRYRIGLHRTADAE